VVEALTKPTLLPKHSRDIAINFLVALNQDDKTFYEYTNMFNEFEKHPNADVNDDVLWNRFITSMANDIIMTYAMSHRAKSVTPLAIFELQNTLNRLRIFDSPHPRRVDRSQYDIDGHGVGRGNGKRPRYNGGNGNGNGGKNHRLDKHEDGPKDKTRGKGKCKLCHKRRFDFNAHVKALTPLHRRSNNAIDMNNSLTRATGPNIGLSARRSRPSQWTRRKSKIDGGQAALMMDRSNRLIPLPLVMQGSQLLKLDLRL
jgi:hypothetical protein